MYKITFLDGTTFHGGEPENSLWNEIPDKPIKSVEYQFTPFVKYLLSDFEAYAHCVERVKGLNQPFDFVSSVIIMGKYNNRVYQILFDKDGGIHQLVVPFGKEYSPQRIIAEGKFKGWLNGKPLAGWLTGNLQQGASPKLREIK